LSPADLAQVLRHLPLVTDPRLIVGLETADDAGVFQVSDTLALVQTVDFFPPVLDDPFDFGQVAAANSLSDVYAMGGTPLTVMNIVGFPTGKLDLSILTEILRGGAEKTREAGAVLAGGHSVSDHEVKYGLAVTGAVDPRRVVTNAAAKPGDRLILTKKLGVGILTSAQKGGKLAAGLLERVTRSMATLNRAASEVMMEIGPNACTDVTGFSLLGHGAKMALASRVTFRLRASGVPHFPEAFEHVRKFRTRGAVTNREHFGAGVRFEPGVAEEMQEVLWDPQTSGGLLISVAGERAEKLLAGLHERGAVDSAIVGEVAPASDVHVRVER
jgi:selenide,water dikinase